MKTLYLDIFSGISGDMFIGALLDLGVSFEQLRNELLKLKVDGYHLHVERKEKAAIFGTKFDVHLHDGHHHHPEPARKQKSLLERTIAPLTSGHLHSHGPGTIPHVHTQEHAHGRNFSDIKKLIESSTLSAWVKEKSIGVFNRVAIAEGKVHGMPPSEVHFHEVGAVDSIVDIVGACIALELLGKPRVLSAPVVEGTGWVNCAHGRFPVPTTATLEILGQRSIALTQCEEPHELVTPTGAAILAEFVEEFGPMASLAAEKIGYGLGTRDNKTRPNVLRAVLGTTAASVSGSWETDTVSLLETNIDDMNPEILGDLVHKALSLGALDLFCIPAVMKKNRSGVLLSLLCQQGDTDKFTEFLLTHTSAFGLRVSKVDRRKLSRSFTEVETNYGPVKVKLGKLGSRVVQRSPEFEACRELAEKLNLPTQTIYLAALAETSKLNP